MVDENLNSAYYLLRAALPAHAWARHGRIVVLGSLAAVQPHANFSAYVATKAALHSLVQAVALENRGLDITINAILPGTIDTAMNRTAMPEADRSRWLSPQKLALLCAQLIGDHGRHAQRRAASSGALSCFLRCKKYCIAQRRRIPRSGVSSLLSSAGLTPAYFFLYLP